MIDPLVGARVRQLREQKLWRQQDLAAAAGVATNTVLGLEHGKQTRFAKFQKIASALDTTTHALLTGEGLPDENPLSRGLKLTDEAVRVGQRFQNAETPIRLAISRLLKVGRLDPMLMLWNRIDSLPPRKKELLLAALAQYEKAAAAEKRERGVPVKLKR